MVFRIEKARYVIKNGNKLVWKGKYKKDAKKKVEQLKKAEKLPKMSKIGSSKKATSKSVSSHSHGKPSQKDPLERRPKGQRGIDYELQEDICYNLGIKPPTFTSHLGYLRIDRKYYIVPADYNPDIGRPQYWITKKEANKVEERVNNPPPLTKEEPKKKTSSDSFKIKVTWHKRLPAPTDKGVWPQDDEGNNVVDSFQGNLNGLSNDKRLLSKWIFVRAKINQRKRIKYENIVFIANQDLKGKKLYVNGEYLGKISYSCVPASEWRDWGYDSKQDLLDQPQVSPISYKWVDKVSKQIKVNLRNRENWGTYPKR